MAIKISEECINCGASEPECPNNAFYEDGIEWSVADGTSAAGSFVLRDGSVVNTTDRFAPLANDAYYIVPGKCTKCLGFHEAPQGASVCLVDCCVPDEQYREKRGTAGGKKSGGTPDRLNDF